ncbi:MAG: phosphoadenylyl-sulfate reductase [Pseudomonadota bacterium]
MTLTPELKAKQDAVVGYLKELLENNQKVVFANSFGAEDMVLTDIIARFFRDQITIFSLDTGRLPEETYEVMHKAEEQYDIKFKVYYPDTASVEDYVRSNGINAFYRSVELRKACCGVRKVEPLKRALANQDAWITGLRAAQSVTRTELAVFEYDEGFGLNKCNPLSDWSEAEVWDYIKAEGVPYNALHDKNYPSIGCAPCTRAISVGEDVRAGRWWWENPESKECGLHAGKVSKVG